MSSMTGTERQFLKSLVRDHYPELYCKNYGVDLVVAEKLTHKELKKRAKKARIKCFNAMTREELAQCIEARDHYNERLVAKIEQESRSRIHFSFTR